MLSPYKTIVNIQGDGNASFLYFDNHLQFLSGHHIVHIKYGQFYLSILLQQIL